MNKRVEALIIGILLIIILAAAAFFRFRGLDWGEYQYLHPDERFLIWVGTDISPVKSLGEYFDTANSSLNPHNRGHGFYVYGTLPLFMARYVVEWIYGHSGFQEMTDIGRLLSSLADLATVGLVYTAGRKLYSRRVGLLAAAFSAAAVLQIQQAHFFLVDSFLTTFSFLAFVCAVYALKSGRENDNDSESQSLSNEPTGTKIKSRISIFVKDPLFLPSLGFGIALGFAVASKLNAAAVVIALPIALVLLVLQQPQHKREEQLIQAFVYLAMAGIVSLIVFRLLQPYAFSGPGILGIKPNPAWVDNIREQRAQSNGDVDFPPAMQWARRPIWFSFQNMLIWGMGIPLGMLAWAGFAWAFWRLLSRWNRRNPEWSSHALVLGWTATYFTWQSMQFNPTMRYQLPIYPTLAILAAWAVVELYDLLPRQKKDMAAGPGVNPREFQWNRIVAVVLGIVVLGLTFGYAYAFTGVYARPITRVAVSRWIYQNLPGPITLPIQTRNGVQNQILSVPYDFRILPQLPYSTNFKPKTAGQISQVLLPHVIDESITQKDRPLSISINSVPPVGRPLTSGNTILEAGRAEDGRSLLIDLEQPITVDPEQTYNLSVSLPFDEPIGLFENNAMLEIAAPAEQDGTFLQNVTLRNNEVQPEVPLSIFFQAGADGEISSLILSELDAASEGVQPQPLEASLKEVDPGGGEFITPVSLAPDTDPGIYKVTLEEPFQVFAGEKYQMNLTMEPGGGRVRLLGTSLANEGDWDDGLPLRLDGYDGYGGIYPLDLNFNMYWDDNPEKLERFLRILDEFDYIAISSNRQWGTLPRIPERFPMTTAYYRNLIGCPIEQSIESCYREAVPGMYAGQLGFDLVQTFSSDPAIGPFQINDQYAEEAFTVYDHPKVLIFKKNSEYDLQNVKSILGGVDFSKIIRKPPLRFSDHPEDLLFPDTQWESQQKGGTWSEIFNTRSPINVYPAVGVIAFYLSVTLLGLMVYPALRLALPGLADHGYPVSRTAGMLVVSYLVWLAGSFHIPFERLTISVGIGLMVVIGCLLGYYQRKNLREGWQKNWRYFLIVEGLTLLFFAVFLLIRYGNPDLWHPWKGGEKPMDFSYFNAVLKSSTFPPYDPWYAGGYLNYYYYGFVLVGTLVKWLGINPAVAYNLILPMLFSMIALGAFSLAWNLSQRANPSRVKLTTTQSEAGRVSPYVPAISASLGLAVLGNLGIVKMIYEGYQKLAAPGGIIDEGGLLTRWMWAARGFLESIKGAHLPYGIGDWYWNPSRIIPAPGDVEPITEFPFFTVLYADLHAHLIALPLTLLALTFIIGIVLGQAHWRNKLGPAIWFLLGGLAIGALRPTNTWDLPTYLGLGILAIIYAVYRKPEEPPRNDARGWWIDIPWRYRRLIEALFGAGLLAGISFVTFQPFAKWYALGYTHIDLWNGTHTKLNAYLYHWGLFLIVIVPWMIWETRDWLAKTPMSALKQLKPYKRPLQVLLGALFAIIALLVIWREVSIAWFVLPLAIWAGMLILRPDQPDAKRIVLFLVGSGLILTLMVEVVVLRGDIGRMNTVFKFYLQVWTLFAVSAAAALGWLWPALDDWSSGWRVSWQTAFGLLAAGAALYPVMGAMAKIEDRMSKEAPHTLNGMAFLRTATYTDTWGPMNLDQDYQAIRWMQENVQGSPVIVEANLRDLYRWGSRYSVYTGLPGVVGWEWHQQQQRNTIPGSWVTDRILEINSFYLTEDWQEAIDFLKKYNVRYIIVGQQERGHYPGPGMKKFEQADGVLWHEVYRTGETVIYEVNETAP